MTENRSLPDNKTWHLSEDMSRSIYTTKLTLFRRKKIFSDDKMGHLFMI